MDRHDAIAVSLLSAVLATVLLPLAPLGLNPHHDGIMLKPALDVWSGQTLFRDTFSQYGALTTYLQAAALAVHPSLLSLRLQTVAAHMVTLFFLYTAWRLLLPRWLAIASGGLFILFLPANELDYWNRELWPLLPWSSAFAMMFQGLGLYALMQVIRGERPLRWGVWLGAATAGAFWCRQPVGVIMAGCLLAIGPALHATGWAPAGLSKRRLLARVLAGFVGVHLPMFAGLAVSGAWHAWWYQNIVWPGKWSGFVDWHESLALCVDPGRCAELAILLVAIALPAWAQKKWPAVSNRHCLVYYLCLGGALAWQSQWTFGVLALRGGGWSLLLPLIVLVQAVISATLVFTRAGATQTTEYHIIASLAAFSLGSLAQYYPAADPWHVLWALAPAFGLVTFVLWRWSGWPASVTTCVLAALFLPAAGAKWRATRQALAQPLVTLSKPAVLQGMQVTAAQARSYDRIMATLDRVFAQRPDIPSALVGYDAIFLCLVPNLANPTPYFVTWAGLAPDSDNARRVDYIRRVRPLIFFHRADWNGVNDFYRSARYVPLLYVPEEALEIAVPQELAGLMGVGAYGAPPSARPGTGP